jgi:hypothetical protein
VQDLIDEYETAMTFIFLVFDERILPRFPTSDRFRTLI